MVTFHVVSNVGGAIILKLNVQNFTNNLQNMLTVSITTHSTIKDAYRYIKLSLSKEVPTFVKLLHFKHKKKCQKCYQSIY